LVEPYHGDALRLVVTSSKLPWSHGLMIAALLGYSSYFLWHAIPIIIAISLVYGATRHELMEPILHSAYRTTLWILGFVGVIATILMIISWLV
jgi:hypothetical protein